MKHKYIAISPLKKQKKIKQNKRIWLINKSKMMSYPVVLLY